MADDVIQRGESRANKKAATYRRITARISQRLVAHSRADRCDALCHRGMQDVELVLVFTLLGANALGTLQLYAEGSHGTGAARQQVTACVSPLESRCPA